MHKYEHEKLTTLWLACLAFPSGWCWWVGGKAEWAGCAGYGGNGGFMGLVAQRATCYVHICAVMFTFVLIIMYTHSHTHTSSKRERASWHTHTHTLTICVYRFQSNTRASTDKFYLQTFHLICKRVAAPQKYPLSTIQQLAHTHTLSKPDSCKCACVCAHTHTCVRECGCADVNASHNVFFSRATENKAFGCPICGSPFKIFTTINI